MMVWIVLAFLAGGFVGGMMVLDIVRDTVDRATARAEFYAARAYEYRREMEQRLYGDERP